MKTYRYPHDFRVKHRSYLSLFLSLIFLLILVGVAIADFQNVRDELWNGLLIVLLAFLNVLYELYRINLYPDIMASEEGLGIEFLWFYIPVPWKDIESIQMIRSSNYPEKFTEWFVRTKKLTPLHLLYGRSRYGDFVTGFLLRSDTEGAQELVDEIGRKIPMGKYQALKKTEYSDWRQ